MRCYELEIAGANHFCVLSIAGANFLFNLSFDLSLSCIILLDAKGLQVNTDILFVSLHRR